jgi:hypothetical protein
MEGEFCSSLIDGLHDQLCSLLELNIFLGGRQDGEMFAVDDSLSKFHTAQVLNTVALGGQGID